MARQGVTAAGQGFQERRIMNRFITGFCLSCLLAAATSALAQISINPTSRAFAKEGGGGSVLTSGSGSWSASTTAGWLNITPRTTGTAGESCIYVVSANFSADSRQGIIQIGGNTHTVNQTGYSATISPTSASVPYTGGSGQISVTTEAGVSWTARANTNWVTVTPESGISVGTVSYTIAPYGGVTPRTTSITIAGKTFSISQTGLDVNIAPYTAEMAYEADIVQVQVSALWDTSWSVEPNASWISVVDGGSGAGDSTVTLAVGTNPSYQIRSGTVSISSAVFTITQRGTTKPILAIVPPTATAEAVGAYGNAAILATPDAPWTAESLNPWLVISQGASGAGNGNIQYVVSSNPDLVERTGRIRVFPPIYQARSDLSWMLFSHVSGGSNDVSGWARNMSGPLTRRFDGTQPWTLTGQPFYRSDDAFTLAFWFNLGSGGSLNRLVGFQRAASSHGAIFVDAADRLAVQCGSETLTTTLAVKTNVEYQVVVAADAARNVCVYAGERDDAMALVGATTFALAPFPMSYITPARIRVGAAEVPNSGNLTDATINDFRVYGRALSNYEAGKLLIHAGASTPYGEFSHCGDSENVRAEYNLQGQCVIAGGPCAGLGNWGSGYSYNCLGRGVSLSTVHTFELNSMVATITGTGHGTYDSRFSYDTTIHWYYVFEYSNGTSASTPERSSFQNDYRRFTESNPNPSWVVDRVKVMARTTGNYPYTAELTSVVNMHSVITGGWQPDANRFGLPKRSLRGTVNAQIALHGNQFLTSPSATYNFWLKYDSLPSSGATPTFHRRAGAVTNFVCSLLPAGRLRFALNGIARDYDAGVQAGRWHMLTVSAQFGGVAMFYVDGEEIGNTPDFGAYEFGASFVDYAFYIGGWDGAIDYMGFYDGQLTSPQIKAIYDAQKPKEVYHTVTQGVVTPSIAPDTASVPAAGGTVSSALTLAHSVNWTAETATPWLQITSPSSGAGSTTVEVLASANPSVYERQGTVLIAGKTFTITQAGLGSSVTCEEQVFGTDGGSAWADVSTEGNAQWQAVSQVSWLTVAIGASGTGAGSVFIVADPYTQTTSSRIGGVLIAGHMVYFTQRGFELSVVPQVAQVGSNAGAGEFGVVAPIGSIWEAITTHPWITITGGTSGQGNGTLRYSVAANTTGTSRTGKIIVSGREYTITQLASLLLTAYTDGGGTIAGGGSYETLASATLTATPDSGHVFSHWTGDAVGSANPLTLSMDSSKTVKAHFIAEDLADTIALNSRERLGLYTTDQMHSLALGGLVIDRDADTGKMNLSLGLQQRESLTSGSWSNVMINEADITIQGGRLQIGVTPAGNAAFYRVQGGVDE